jgi:transposase InsO family protein
MKFVVMASRQERSLTDLCSEFGISRPTGYGWLKRYQAHGIAGMQEESRRPHHSPARTAAELETRVVELRRERPDWGGRKIQHLLRQKGIELPASTIHRIFLRYQLVRDGDRQPRALQRFERAQPNQLWQMDFKGPKGWDQAVGPLSVLDDHSRYALALENTGSTQAQGVQAVLERVFRESGVPEEMLMDHGTPWFNPQGRLGWSQFTVWLMD